MHRNGYSSRDDVSINSFKSSSGDSRPFSGLDPRTRSTSDLFEVPVGRIKPKMYKRASTTSATLSPQIVQRSSQNLSLIPEQTQLPYLPSHSLTPYQKQRKLMKNSFQFPNGESFTPKQKPIKAFSSYNGKSHGSGLPKSASCSNFHAGVDRTNSLVMPEKPNPSIRSGSFTAASVSYTPIRPINRFHKSASTSRLSLDATYGKNQLPLSGNAPNGRLASQPPLRSAPAYLTSNFNSHSSKTQAVSSNNSTNSTNSMKSENVVSSNTSTDASETPLKPVAPIKDVPSNRYTLKPSGPAQVLSAPKRVPASASVQITTAKPMVPAKPIQKTPLIQPVKPNASKGVKISSSSRISSFFRKLLPSKKTKKIIPEGKPPMSKSNTPGVIETKLVETPSISISRPSHSSSHEAVTVSEKAEFNEADLDGANDGDNEVDDYDDDDDQLLDIDLVFDSLLLKSDHPTTATSISQKTTQRALSPEVKSSEPAIEKKVIVEDSNIDYGLVEEFSRLGSLIADDNKSSESLAVTPPPRSLKRPLLANKESMAGFYRKHASENKVADPDARLDVNLKRDWENVHYDTVIALVTVHEQPNKGIIPKRLRFGQSVYVKDTYAASDYERSDKKFIRARRRMMQTQNMTFIQAVKHQLNEFKKEEMMVHNESLKNTHYFL
ncbi:Afr1p LALA0_S07e07316g [Lachancea lanzarotensis]|uniref:LALA0S07e07316g1_1 n=1 Tax=Lachancea lanzarotensis TaxID=1245769 RepID=A0A0C7NCF0_9SACH|nr:uncharacterized protein LALA0_S07e07316g [Lachancea lanzarotensis]CEP63314.1 LALA0S07e07316g1_1 [Lachancea lanzarotensis]